jgi:hypothetical protein
VEVVYNNSGARVSNETMRFRLYRAFTYAKFGNLGTGHPIPLPSCAGNKIKEMYPSTDGKYVGFQAEKRTMKR